MKKQPQPFEFDLPSEDLKELSFCRADRESMSRWVGNLPVADMGSSTRLLYRAVREVSQLKTSAANRMELLEVLRPATHVALTGLKRNYLNQPITLPEKAAKIANLSQALQSDLALAYIVTAGQCVQKMGSLFNKPKALLSQAIYRALGEYTQILVRNYLLYRPIKEDFWLKIHKLYLLASSYNLHEQELEDPLFPGQPGSIKHGYLLLLLWGGVKANQLRQDDIEKLQEPIHEWASYITLEIPDKTQQLTFIVDSKMDLPLIYQKFYTGKYHLSCWSLNTGKLIEYLQQLTGPLNPEQSIAGQAVLPSNLINHLILAWGIFTERTFMRLDGNSQLTLCVGLSTCHYFISGCQSFNQLVYGEDEPDQQIDSAEFKAKLKSIEQVDVWDQALFDSGKKPQTQVTLESIDYHVRSGGNSVMTFTGFDKEKYQNFEVDIVNISPGGYCVEWANDAPHSVKSGEIVCIKEDHHQTWNVGAIRWARQDKEQLLQIGVELLGPAANPYGAHIVNNAEEGPSVFMRVLVLPEMKTIGQSSTLITPSMNFEPGQHVVLISNNQEHTIRLNQLVAATGSYFQFTFDDVKPLASDEPSGKIDGFSRDTEFDSVWELL